MRISSKLVLFALVCSILPLLAAFWLSFNAARSSLAGTLEENLVSRASEELAALQQRLNSAKHDLSLFGRLNVMQEVLWGHNADTLQADLDLFATASPDFVEILVANRRGRAVAATNADAIGTDLRNTWEYEAPRLGIEFDGPVVNSYRLHEPISTQASPIFARRIGDGRERVIGALIGSISWNAVTKDLHEHTLFGGVQGPGRQIVLQGTADNRILYATPGVEVLDVLLEPLASGSGFRDLQVDGRKLLAASVDSVAIAPFRDPGWRLHVVLDADIAYASVNELRDWFVRVGVSVLVLACLLAYLLARSITRPVESLVTAAERLARGDDDAPVPGGGRDEIGQLATSFESMRRAVRANEQELTRKSEQAEAAARFKGEFLANMSHEVRTPINGVLGMTELLLNTPLGDTQTRYAETIFRSGQSLLAVINDILDFSKIEAGKLEVQATSFDLRELVEDLFEMVAESAHRKGLELALDMAPGSHVAYRGDANRIRQVLLNLLSNAIKFTEQGEVRLEVRACPVDAVPVGTGDVREKSLSHVSLTVVDTGIGIPDSAIASVFESFVQADGSTTRRFGGTGLGLAISSRLAKLMGGDIDVVSVPGEGSTFCLQIPLESLPVTVSDAWREPDALVGRRVLVVDDNANNREILETQMHYWGAIPVMSNHAHDALAAVLDAEQSGLRFDLVVLDMHMPDMNGLELARTLLENGQVVGASMVLLSSVCDQLDPAACTAAGIDSVITKPVRQPELYRCLTALLDGERQETPSTSQMLTERALEGRVLLVEDNPVNQFMMTEMLRQLGLDVVLADHGRAAIEALDSGGYAPGGFDAVLMDCQMPVLDGFAASREIRASELITGRHRMPIIALTANALEGDREACLQAGMDDYLSKPVSAKRLVAQLSLWLDTAVTTPDKSEAADESKAGDASPDDCGDSSTSMTSASELEPVLDRRIYDEVIAMAAGAQPGFLDELLTSYRVSAGEDVDGVRSALESGDATALASRAHRLKSSSANWGARRLAAYCAEVETAARAGDVDAAWIPASALAGKLAEVLDEIVPSSTRRAA